MNGQILFTKDNIKENEFVKKIKSCYLSLILKSLISLINCNPRHFIFVIVNLFKK